MNDNIDKKLFELQKRIGTIPKEETNPYFKSKYFDINGLLRKLKPVLHELNLIILQPIVSENGYNILKTIVKDVQSGQEIVSEIALPKNEDPQKMGTIIAYYRRYSIQSFLLLEAEDDDGNSASIPSSNVKTEFKEIQPSITIPPSVLNKIIQKQPDQNFEHETKPSGSAWKNVRLHFGKNKDMALGQLKANQLNWYINEWQPKPFNGKISEKDRQLRIALDDARYEKANANTSPDYQPDVQNEEGPTDDDNIPF